MAQLGLTGSDAAQAKINLRNEQANLLDRIRALDPNARVVASTQAVLNAVFVEVDAAVLPKLALDKAVVRIAPVGNYQLDLSETVPYIGACDRAGQGRDGRGIKVAVLDSGIDYLHAGPRRLGQSGRFRERTIRTIIEPGTFPTAKVVGGYDFTGQRPGRTRRRHRIPIRSMPAWRRPRHARRPHHCAARAALRPAPSLYAVKVCSSVSTSCSGIALIQGMDFAVDPNGDGKLNDRVDIINMSLGSPYGQPFDDDLSVAVDNATTVGRPDGRLGRQLLGQAVRRMARRRQRSRRCRSRRPPCRADSCR